MEIADIINELLDDTLADVREGLSDGKMRANTIKKLVLMLSVGKTELTKDEFKKQSKVWEENFLNG